MDLTLLVGLAGTVLGGLIAAGAGWWQAKRQRKWQIEDFERQLAAARDAEVRKRADEKADEVLRELDILDRLLLGRIRLGFHVWPADDEESKAARQALRNIDRAALYLQQPLRQHVEIVSRVVSDVDQLAQQRFIDDHPRTITWSVIHHARSMVGQYLRGEVVAADLPEEVKTYTDGADALDEYIERQIAEQEARARDEARD